MIARVSLQYAVAIRHDDVVDLIGHGDSAPLLAATA